MVKSRVSASFLTTEGILGPTEASAIPFMPLGLLQQLNIAPLKQAWIMKVMFILGSRGSKIFKFITIDDIMPR